MVSRQASKIPMTKRWPYYILGFILVLGVLGLLYGLFRPGKTPLLFPQSASEVQRMPCTLAERGLLPEAPSPFPPVEAHDWTFGSENASVTLIEYGDFQCPHCGILAPELIRLREELPEDVRLVFRHFPLESLHDKARLAAQAAEAAGAQGKFWQMHDVLFLQQEAWVNLSEAEFKDWLTAQAQTLELDVQTFTADLTSQSTVDAVRRAYDAALATGLDSTPSLVINGQYYEGAKDWWTLASFVRLIQLESRQFSACPPQQIVARKQYIATLETTQGTITLELLPRQAPLAVNNFVFLARQGWYDGVEFYRVIPGYVTQTGDPSGTGLGGPGYTFADEISPDLRFAAPGVVAMANSGPDSNGSQFFITYSPQPSLDGSYTIFGTVIAGLDVLQALAKRDPAMDTLALPPADKIVRVTIEER